MLTTLKRGFELLNAAQGRVDGAAGDGRAELPLKTGATYRGLSGRTRWGGFQVESRAQMSCSRGSDPASSTTW
jgi:DNA polymerase III alpha subunit